MSHVAYVDLVLGEVCRSLPLTSKLLGCAHSSSGEGPIVQLLLGWLDDSELHQALSSSIVLHLGHLFPCRVEDVLQHESFLLPGRWCGLSWILLHDDVEHLR